MGWRFISSAQVWIFRLGYIFLMNVISDSSEVDTWVTTAGELVTTKYEDGFGHGDYCVDKTGAGEVVAVMCNPCGRKVRTLTRSNR